MVYKKGLNLQNSDEKTASALILAFLRFSLLFKKDCAGAVPGSLNKKGGRRFHLSSIFCLIKNGTLFLFDV
jgi:hypothetical protein